MCTRQAGQATVYLGLGANLGDRWANIRKALKFLSREMHIEKLSSIYETEPVGYLDQSPFLNAVCRATTCLSPLELLDLAKNIEACLGRVASFPNAPRPIDIDILFYDREVIHSPRLTVPHPRLTERGFVLEPLHEIAHALIDPATGKSIEELREKAAKEGCLKGVVRKGEIMDLPKRRSRKARPVSRGTACAPLPAMEEQKFKVVQQRRQNA